MMACIWKRPSGRITTRAGQLTVLSALLLLGASFAPVAASAAPGETELVSLTVDGKGAGGYTRGMSPDARFVVFRVKATNVLPGGNPAFSLVLKDRLLGTTRFVVRIELGSTNATVSADGRYVAFEAWWDLLPSDTNRYADVYVRDMLTQQTVLASVSSDEESTTNGHSLDQMISANGRYVVFESVADGLVPGDTNGHHDVFVRDLQSGTTERVSISSGEAQANSGSLFGSISADGRFVVFRSYSTNLVPGDTNNFPDVFLRDRVAGTTERISVASDGSQADNYSYSSAAAPTPDGRFVVFVSEARNLVPNDTNEGMDVFVRDRWLGRTERASVSSEGVQANADSVGGTVSQDGRYVAFDSQGSTLVPGDLNNRFDAFVRDREAGTTVRVSVSTFGVQGNATSSGSMISADGRLVVFNSEATNLVDNETFQAGTGSSEVYLHEMGTAPGAPAFVVDPARLVIDNATIWADTTRNVMFTNTGAAAISVTALSLSGADSAQFGATHVCGSTVPVGDACLIKITARPTSTGLKTARLAVSAGNATQTVELSATGILAQFTLTPTALSFPSQRVGTQSAGQWVKVRNTGAGVLPVKWVGLVGPDASQFSRQRWCPAQLQPGRVCNVPVYFKPTSTGAKSARLIVSPGPSGARRHVALSGTGI